MSYDLQLKDPVTGEIAQGQTRHHLQGGTYAVGGTTNLELNVTYNYAAILNNVIDGGIRLLDGITGAESIHILSEAIEKLGDDATADYWEATEGNVKQALKDLKTLAIIRPDAVWEVIN